MKKIVVFFVINIFLFAKSDKYLTYVNKLVNYNFELKNIEGRKAPFEIKKIVKKTNKKNIQNILVKKIKIELISIFNNQAYIKIKEFLGDQLIKSENKWVKVGDKVSKCKVNKITKDKIIFKCNNKILIKSLNKKIPGLKEVK